MMYLVIILIAGQIIHFIHLRMILASAKRRAKSLDFKLHNLNQWCVSNQHTLMNKLEEIQDQVNNLYVKISMAAMDLDHGKSTEANEPATTFSILMQAFNKEPIDKFRKEDIQHYYAILLQELQQLDSKISQVANEAIHNTPYNNTQIFKNEIKNRLNGSRFNKNNLR
ncbi:hypothetical protein A3860_18075 [Niastella vici]|uniref:Uncharacterized protein n=1 Tax=Niastella vici TaxID=1703345 RepID=A0A1V9G200_9BACT|nr:hypothetical protein [Niastella vici]OQP64669.1 hypothetical protein A3860_18075 [Niastella vici]